MHKSLKYLIPAFMAFTLAACGGSDSKSDAEYSGNKKPASFGEVTPEKKQEIGHDSSKVIVEAVSMSDSDEFLAYSPLGVEVNDDTDLHEKVKEIAKKVLAKKQGTSSSNLPVGVKHSQTDPCEGGGQETFTMDLNENTGHGTFTVSYKDCKEVYFDDDYDITNGKVTIVFTDDKMKMEFKNLETKEVWDGKTETSKFSGYYQFSGSAFNFSEDASVDLETAEFNVDWDLTGHINNKPFSSKGNMTCIATSCKFGATVKADDGKVYKVEEFEVSSTGSSNSVKGKIYHPDYGHYTFTATIDGMCDYDEKSPFVGEATFTDSSNETISYKSTSCDSEPAITY